MTDWKEAWRRAEEVAASVTILGVVTWRCGKPLKEEWRVRVALITDSDYDRIFKLSHEIGIGLPQLVAESVDADTALPVWGEVTGAFAPFPDDLSFKHLGKCRLSDKAVEKLGIPSPVDVTQQVIDIWKQAPTMFRRVVHLTDDRLFVGTSSSNPDSDGLRYSQMEDRPKGAQRYEVDDWDFEVPIPVTLRWDPFPVEGGIELTPAVNIPGYQNAKYTLEMLGVEPKIVSRDGLVVFLLDDKTTIIVEGEL